MPVSSEYLQRLFQTHAVVPAVFFNTCRPVYHWFTQKGLVVYRATLGSDQSERSKICLDQSEARISPM